MNTRRWFRNFEIVDNKQVTNLKARILCTEQTIDGESRQGTVTFRIEKCRSSILTLLPRKLEKADDIHIIVSKTLFFSERHNLEGF